MPDIKIRPQTDSPKIRKMNDAPKEISGTLKRHYQDQQKQRRPEHKGAVQQATEDIENAAVRGTVVTVNGVHRTLKHQRQKRHLKTDARRQGRAFEEAGGAYQTGAKIRSLSASIAPETKDARLPQKARYRAQRIGQRKLFDRTSEKVSTAAKTGGHFIVQSVRTISRAVKSATAPLLTASGAAVMLLVVLMIVLIAAVVASPFGLLFADANATKKTVPVAAAAAQVQARLNDRLTEIQSAQTYDDITLTGQIPDWADVLAVFAVKVTGDELNAVDVVTMDEDRIDRLESIFMDMCDISYEVDVTHHSDSDPADGVDDSWTERNLTISITPSTALEMAQAYHFDAKERAALQELLEQSETLAEMSKNLSAVSFDAAEILAALPQDLSPERRAVVTTACSLVGKVNYFWGGKSAAIGWDDRWGQLYKVDAAGSPTSGTYRPYGLDCSGFVDWVFNNALDYVIGHGGGAIMQHSYCTDIAWDDALPGDLVFYEDDEHVGIVGGRDVSGKLLVIHCASGYNNVVITDQLRFEDLSKPNCYEWQSS